MFIATRPAREATPEVKIRLQTLGQLFNSLDPSPFHEKELDKDAEDYIVGSVDEIPLPQPLSLLIELPIDQLALEDSGSVQDAVRNHFAYRLEDGRRRLRFQFREGRFALLIGLLFLSLCVVVRELIFAPLSGAAAEMAAEGLLILGWVAMWRPLQIFLYDWWPVRHQLRLYAKLAGMPVVLRQAS